MSVGSYTMLAMTASMAIGLVLALAIGFALGWLAHAARAGVLHTRTVAGGEQIAHIVGPLRDAVGALATQVARVETDRAQSYAGLREQVAGMHRTSEFLTTQTSQLVAALRAPSVRGRWGEIQLERVVEMAGMVKHCDFDTQVTRGGARPDLVVYLAGGKQIVVDAKVPLAAYLDAAQENEPVAQARHLALHARQLRNHVDELAEKAYWEEFDPTPEFVVLFVPGDPLLDAALTADASLLEYAFSKNVILATPTTLVALLRTIAHTWRQEAVSRDAATIAQLGRELYSRIGTVATYLDRMGNQLGKAVESFNQTVASMESRVIVTARKLNDLQRYDGDVPDIGQVETWPRAVAVANISTSNGHANDAF